LKDWNEKYKNRVNEAYYEILREVMKRGGDTDTNACIVGAFIGALVGFAKIPKLYRENFLNCDVT
jgi:ADP-ribosylglycohydrolase